MQHEIKPRPSQRGRLRAGQGKYFCQRCGAEGTLAELRASECNPGDTAEP
jgi:hypothetical protein